MVRDDDFLAGPKMANDNHLMKTIVDAREKTTEEYKKEVVEEVNRSKKNNKRRVKNSPAKFDAKRRLGAFGIALGIGIGAALATSEFKEEVFDSTLATVKEEIAENVGTTPDKVQIKGVTEEDVRNGGVNITYTLTVDGQRYEYMGHQQSGGDGDIIVLKDEIENNEVLEAIETVVNADGGNIFDAIKANRLKKDIESGKINLNVVLREKTNKALDEAGMER